MRMPEKTPKNQVLMYHDMPFHFAIISTKQLYLLFVPGDSLVDVQIEMLLDDVPEDGVLLLRHELALVSQLGVGVAAHPHRELRRPEVLHQLGPLHVLSFGDVRQLLDVLLVERLLLGTELFDVGLKKAY